MWYCTISRAINPSINLIYCTLLDCTGLFLLTLAYLQYLYRARDTDLYLDTTTPPKPGFSRAGQTTGTDNPFLIERAFIVSGGTHKYGTVPRLS